VGKTIASEQIWLHVHEARSPCRASRATTSDIPINYIDQTFTEQRFGQVVVHTRREARVTIDRREADDSHAGPSWTFLSSNAVSCFQSIDTGQLDIHEDDIRWSQI
jgi:hypothetical protein